MQLPAILTADFTRSPSQIALRHGIATGGNEWMKEDLFLDFGGYHRAIGESESYLTDHNCSWAQDRLPASFSSIDSLQSEGHVKCRWGNL